MPNKNLLMNNEFKAAILKKVREKWYFCGTLSYLDTEPRCVKDELILLIKLKEDSEKKNFYPQ